MSEGVREDRRRKDSPVGHPLQPTPRHTQAGGTEELLHALGSEQDGAAEALLQIGQAWRSRAGRATNVGERLG